MSGSSKHSLRANGGTSGQVGTPYPAEVQPLSVVPAAPCDLEGRKCFKAQARRRDTVSTTTSPRVAATPVSGLSRGVVLNFTNRHIRESLKHLHTWRPPR
jgi:hypothetical protein